MDDTTVFRAGYDYGANPIPNRGLNPLLAAIGENHFAAGLSHRFAPNWSVESGVEYGPPTSVTYTNPELPFGTNAQERNSYVALTMGVSRAW
jgi:long-chain fatty acid transport protein